MAVQIGIMDYGVGNLHSIKKGFEGAGATCDIVKDARKISGYDSIVFPGVGAFGASMKKLEPVKDEISSRLKGGVPALCICIGMQILFDKSDEETKINGLSVLKGNVIRLKTLKKSMKVPHMGWNSVSHNDDTIFNGIRQGQEFYFVHSYVCIPESKKYAIATTDYGGEFVSAIRYKNTYGFQFHPEKSTAPGLRLLRNFVKLSETSR